MMLKLWAKTTTLFRKDDGQSMVEYGLIIALIAIVVMTTVALIGTNLKGIFQQIAGNLT